ncbi:phosphoribosylaminoimidazolesuccinocarboxamide synthase [Chloroflexota bacterium]
MDVLLETDLPNKLHRGKVRDIYPLGDDLLIVATDRISAFDSVLPAGIPDKGAVLNLLSAFWFEQTSHIVPSHMVEVVEDTRILDSHRKGDTCFVYPSYLAHRSMIVKKAERIDVECVVRGYISGSAWAEYEKSGTVGGLKMPAGLKESEQFPEPIFTPTTKADTGHDEPITIEEMENLIGKSLTGKIIEKTMAIYGYAEQYARSRGIIIADTKMEFGLVDGELILIDELLTPDSSRFWDAGEYSSGKSQPSFDKQPLRDWLIDSGWDKEPPAPALPTEIVEETAERYREAYRRLTGRKL